MKNNIIEITEKNIENEHIGCAVSQTADALRCAGAKKEWMRAAFEDGYRFWRLDARGKALIETMPGQNAWAPVQAEGWLFIHCLWVSGSFKGQGVATRLLETARTAARQGGYRGLAALSTTKKRAFLSDGAFYAKKGFVVADTAPPDFTLLALPFDKGAPLPSFKPHVKTPATPTPAPGPHPEKGITLYYTHQCPHTGKYAALLQGCAQKAGVPFSANRIATRQDAQKAPCPFPLWAMYYGGVFLTNEIFSEKKLEKFLESV